MSVIATAAMISGGAAALGAGASLYGSYTSSEAQKTAAANNTYLTDKQADATLAVSTYQNNLNKAVALAQANVADQNAQVYHTAARSSENLGFMQESREVMQQSTAASQTRATYGGSGVEGDTGSPLAVAAHNAGIAQMSRMDTAYNANLDAMKEDWAGSLSSYQSTLDRETAKQYDYANQMAQWTDTAAKAGATVQQTYSDAAANAQLVSGIGQTISSLGNAYGNYGYAKNMSSRVPSVSIPSSGNAGSGPNAG